MVVSSVSGAPSMENPSKSFDGTSANYPTVVFRVKGESRVSLMEREYALNAFDRRIAIQEIRRALNAWYYNQ